MSRFQPPFCSHWVLWEMLCQLRSVCVTSTSAWMGSAMLPQHLAASHFPLWSQVKQCPHHYWVSHKGPMAWSSPQRASMQEGRPSLWAPTDTTSSGTWALGLLRLRRSLVHLTRNLARVISLLCFVVCESMAHYSSSLSCCLCPVVMLSQRAVTPWCPPAHSMVGPSFSQELGHHRMQPVSLRVWSDGLRAGSRWLWLNRHVGM